MSDFFNDNLSIPLPRIDGKPLTGSSSEVPATEYNKLWASVDSLRKAMNDRLEAAYNVRAYGAVPDVLTSAQASLNATAFAYGMQDAASKGKAFYVPPGTYLLPGFISQASAIPVPTGTEFVGRGYGTVLKLNASTFADGTGIRVFQVMGSNCQFRNFRIDGNRGAFNRTGLTSLQTVFFQKGIGGAMDNIRVEDVWAHDVIGIGQESFVFSWHLSAGITATGALTNLVYRNCDGWNNEGTPFHINGTIDNSSGGATWDSGANSFMTDGALMTNCRCWGNTWQGVSVYGAKNVRVENGYFFSNSVNGLNVEWSKEVTFFNNHSYGNAQRGASVIGRTGRVLFQENKLLSNNTVNSSNWGEITVVSGTWADGSPLPRGVGGTIEIRNNKVEPLAGQYHLRVQRDASVTVGAPISDSIIIQQDDFSSWIVGEVGSAGNRVHFNIGHQGGAPVIHQVNTGLQTDWTVQNSGTIATYAGAGSPALNAGAITISDHNTQFGGARSKAALLPGRTYRIRARVRSEDANAEWYMAVHDSGTNQTFLASHQAIASQVAGWYTLDAVTTINPAWAICYVVFQRNTAAGTAGQLSVDYVNVEELASAVSMSEATTWAGRIVGRGTAAPTTGTYPQNAIWMNDNAAASGFIGWVCVTAGTPGTWKTWGAISA